MDLEETINFSDFENLIKTIQSLKEKHKTKTLIYNKWTKVTKPLPKGTKISRKIPCIAKVSHVCVDLIKQLQFSKDPLNYAHMQFKAFKPAR